MNKKLPLEESCQQKLSKLPRNSAKNRIRNSVRSLEDYGVYRKLKISDCSKTIRTQGKIPGMVKSSWQKGNFMSLSDPIGDMLARIKNSQMRNHKKQKCLHLILKLKSPMF